MGGEEPPNANGGVPQNTSGANFLAPNTCLQAAGDSALAYWVGNCYWKSGKDLDREIRAGVSEFACFGICLHVVGILFVSDGISVYFTLCCQFIAK